ncbi:MAG: hypothetical protein ACP5DZ_07095 [Bacteroidales bacterium]
MPAYFSNIFNYLLDAVTATLLQVLMLFGPLLVLAFLMHQVSRQVEKHSTRLMGSRGYLYAFGWLGTAVHETGHAFFCLVFGHKITGMKLFSPDHENGTLGHVNHSYNCRNPYHNIGNFFIGIGPVIFGSFLLYGLVWLLFDVRLNQIAGDKIMPENFSNVDTILATFQALWTGVVDFVSEIKQNSDNAWWKVLILMYVLFAAGSAVSMSKADIAGAFSGFKYILILMFLINLICLSFKDFIGNIISEMSTALSAFYFLLIISLIINNLFLLFLFFVRKLFYR